MQDNTQAHNIKKVKLKLIKRSLLHYLVNTIFSLPLQKNLKEITHYVELALNSEHLFGICFVGKLYPGLLLYKNFNVSACADDIAWSTGDNN